MLYVVTENDIVKLVREIGVGKFPVKVKVAGKDFIVEGKKDIEALMSHLRGCIDSRFVPWVHIGD